MSKPLVVSIPHHLGKDEAVRRLKSGLGSVRTSYGHLFNVQEETWSDNRLQFRVSALGQAASGTIDVALVGPSVGDGQFQSGPAIDAIQIGSGAG